MFKKITVLTLTLALLAVFVAVPDSHVMAYATQSNPVNNKAGADCNGFGKAVKIDSGKNKGKWYCKGYSSPPQPDASGSGGNGANPGASGAGGTSTPADQAACAGLTQLSGASCDSNTGQSVLGNIANRAVILLSYIAGIIAVFMIILAGVRYTTSGGDPNKVGGAKTALIYALVGLAIAALAQFLTHFVLSNTP